MPIYEYICLDPGRSCHKCIKQFEFIQAIAEKAITVCPECGNKIRKVMSWCHSAIIESSDEHARVEKKIGEYERKGMWSHAAELADKHSEKVNDKGLKTRALENYRKAGYNADSLAKHAKINNK
jgi:putative FmdB family regulatory protein